MRRSLVDAWLSIGEYPEESETQRARRRIILATTWVASLLTVLTILSEFLSGPLWVALSDTGIIVVTAVLLMGLHLSPRRFALIINLLLGTVFVVQVINTTLFGGLLESGLVVIFNLAIVLAALLGFGYRAASWWFAAFVASVVYAALIHNRIDPLYDPRPTPSTSCASATGSRSSPTISCTTSSPMRSQPGSSRTPR